MESMNDSSVHGYLTLGANTVEVLFESFAADIEEECVPQICHTFLFKDITKNDFDETD